MLTCIVSCRDFWVLFCLFGTRAGYDTLIYLSILSLVALGVFLVLVMDGDSAWYFWFFVGCSFWGVCVIFGYGMI
jgi:hypothetical protein